MKFVGFVGRVVAVGTFLILGMPISAPAQPAGAPAPTGRIVVPGAPTAATQPGTQVGNMQSADALAAAALAASPTGTADGAPLPAAAPKPQINLWQLANDGGPLMYPIYAMSVIVVCFAFERAFGLRRRRLLPPGLVKELGELSKRSSGVDPRAAYRACQRYPSTAATVLKSVLLKIGRPFAELEETLKEANEREAAKLYKNVRPMELSISVAPLLGLLGTVQGMIMAFFVTANADLHVNKAEQLAQGIYVALVTTFAGLCVAIPAAILAHYFEGKIQTFFRELDELILGLLPQWERYEGKLRVNTATLGEAETPATPPEPPPVGRHPTPAGRT
jgi:biopolymer transport protein ExbB